MLNIAYGGLLFEGILEAVNSKENFNEDVFMLNICISGYVCLYLSYYDFYKAFIVSLCLWFLKPIHLESSMYAWFILWRPKVKVIFFYPATQLTYLYFYVEKSWLESIGL